MTSHRRAPILIALALLVVAAPACMTQNLDRIVEKSNRAMEASAILRQTDLPELVAPDGAGGGPNGKGSEEWNKQIEEQRTHAIQLIDRFIETHAGHKPAINALLIRKALLHLAGGETNFAKATFSRFDATKAGGERDYGLYLSHSALAWWWRMALVSNPGQAEFNQGATTHTVTLDTTLDKLNQGSAISYYLATTRAHIYLKWATIDDDAAGRLKEGLSLFCAAFGEADRTGVKTWATGTDDERAKLPLAKLRWYGHAEIVKDRYAAMMKRALGRDPVVSDWDADCQWLVKLP
jgi:hypothetical protein